MSKILFTTPELEHPPRGGPKLRVENAIKALSRLADLIIVSRVPVDRMGGERAVSFYRQFCRELLFITNQSAEGYALYLIALANREQIDVIWLGYGNISYEILFNLKKHNCRFPVVVDTDSVWSRFLLRGLPFKSTFEEKLMTFANGWVKRWEEFLGTKLAEVTTAVSSFDAQYYRSLNSNEGAVKVFSNVIDIDNYRYVPPVEQIRKPCAYLAGTFGPNSPMEEAALWMIEKVLPIIWKELPSLHFYLVGVGATEKMKACVNGKITITGAVESVLPYLSNVNVAVVPLKYESGTRFKIMEAGACRIPIVSTSLGAEGIPVKNGVHLLIADQPEEFAQAILQIINNPAFGTALAEECYGLISRNYSISTALTEAETVLKACQIRSSQRTRAHISDCVDEINGIYNLLGERKPDHVIVVGLSRFNQLVKILGDDSDFFQLEELKQALEFINEALRAIPNFPLLVEAQKLCGECLEKRTDYAKKREGAMYLGVGIAEGYRLIQQGNYDEALKVLDSTLKSDAENLALHHARFVCLEKLGMRRETLQAAKVVLMIEPGNSVVPGFLERAITFSVAEIKSFPDRILSFLDQVVEEIGRPLPGLQYSRGLCLLKKGELELAIGAFETEAALNCSDAIVGLLRDLKLVRRVFTEIKF